MCISNKTPGAADADIMIKHGAVRDIFVFMYHLGPKEKTRPLA